MTLADAYYIRLGGKVQGPYGIEELHRLAKRGRFSRLWNVSEDGITWHRASEFPELFPPPSPRALRHEPTRPTEGDSESEAAVPTVTSPHDSEWHYVLDGQTQGPVDFLTLQLMAISPDALVWTEGMTDWVEARHVDGLVPVLEPGQVRKSVGMRLPGSGKVDPLAIASLLFALAGMTCLFVLGSIVAVVLGHIALKQISDGDGASRRLAIFGLSIGYIGLIVGVVVGLILLVGAVIQADPAPMG